MASAIRSLDVRASADVVWAIWSKPDAWHEWNPDVISVSLDGELAPGTSGEMLTKQRRHQITFVWVQPGRSFALEISPMPLIKLLFACEVMPTERGCTISQRVDITGPLARLFGGPMSKQIGDTFPPILEALKHTAEGVRVI